jgi:hypothetical protein
MRILAVLLTCLAAVQARADVGSRYGYGSRSQALAGASAAWGQEAYATYLNPAGLAAPEMLSESTRTDRRLAITWGITDLTPNFSPISQVVIENTTVSDKNTIGDVDQGYKATFGQVLGIQYRLLPEWMDLTLGLTAFLPLAQIGYLDSGEPYIPEYALYRADTLRPQFNFGAGLRLGDRLRAGVGIHVAYSITGSASVFLQTDPAKPSSMRVVASEKAKASPYVGLLFFPAERPEDWSIGLVARAPLKSDGNFTIKTAASILADFAALDFNFNALSAVYYDPLMIQLGTAIRHSGWGRIFLQAEYQAWGKYESPSIVIVNPEVTNCQGTSCVGGVTISPGQNTAPPFRNIFVYRVGEEIRLSEKTTLRAGYAHRPSIVNGSGTGNFLDPDVNLFNAGVGFRFASFLSYEMPCTLDLHASYHALSGSRVERSGNEIGSPGYDVGGKVYGGGASLTIAF